MNNNHPENYGYFTEEYFQKTEKNRDPTGQTPSYRESDRQHDICPDKMDNHISFVVPFNSCNNQNMIVSMDEYYNGFISDHVVQNSCNKSEHPKQNDNSQRSTYDMYIQSENYARNEFHKKLINDHDNSSNVLPTDLSNAIILQFNLDVQKMCDDLEMKIYKTKDLIDQAMIPPDTAKKENYTIKDFMEEKEIFFRKADEIKAQICEINIRYAQLNEYFAQIESFRSAAASQPSLRPQLNISLQNPYPDSTVYNQYPNNTFLNTPPPNLHLNKIFHDVSASYLHPNNTFHDQTASKLHPDNTLPNAAAPNPNPSIIFHNPPPNIPLYNTPPPDLHSNNICHVPPAPYFHPNNTFHNQPVPNLYPDNTSLNPHPNTIFHNQHPNGTFYNIPPPKLHPNNILHNPLPPSPHQNTFHNPHPNNTVYNPSPFNPHPHNTPHNPLSFHPNRYPNTDPKYRTTFKRVATEPISQQNKVCTEIKCDAVNTDKLEDDTRFIGVGQKRPPQKPYSVRSKRPRVLQNCIATDASTQPLQNKNSPEASDLNCSTNNTNS